MTSDLFDNARFFYPRTSDDPLVDGILNELADILNVGGKQKQRLILKYLILDMRLRYIELPDGWLICSRDRNSNVEFYNATEPYKSLNVTFNPLVSIMDKLHTATPALIELVPGIHYDNASYATRIRPTEALLEFINAIPEELVRSQAGVVQEVVLKEKIISFVSGKRKVKKRRIGFDLTEDIKHIINQVKFFNDRFKECKLDLYNPAQFSVESELSEGFKQTQINVNLNNKYIFRSYIDNFERGGRFYGGWWQGVPSSLRSHILIDDEPSVEVDFKGHHIALLYSIAGSNYFADDVNRDPYKVDCWPRKDVKLLLQIVLNSSRDNVVKAYNNQRQKDGDDCIPSERLETLVSLFEEMHSPIKSYFYGDWGVLLQNFDAKIAAYVMADCMKNGVTDTSGRDLDSKFIVLPVHDSFIVKYQHLEQLIYSMRMAVVDAIMEAEYSYDVLMEQYRPVMKISEMVELDAIPEDDSYLDRYNLHRDGITIPELKIHKRTDANGVDIFCVT